MSSRTRIGAIALSVVLILSVVGPAIVAADGDENDSVTELDVAVAQDDGVFVTVTDNETAVEGANVNVTVDDENASYAGAGEYVTDENGTVELDEPDETVNVTVTAAYENVTAVITETLIASDEEEAETENGPFGQQVSAFVVENNPGNAPDHAGERGPPAHAGGDGAGDSDRGNGGPPAHAGGSGGDDADDDGDDNDADASENDRGNGGPPAHAGGNGGR